MVALHQEHAAKGLIPGSRLCEVNRFVLSRPVKSSCRSWASEVKKQKDLNWRHMQVQKRPIGPISRPILSDTMVKVC